MNRLTILTRGFWVENPVLTLLLGCCPTLAVTSSLKNGVSMGLASTCVLLGSNAVVSLCRKVIPAQVRIPCYIVIIATFVTIVQMLMQAYAPDEINKSLGIFIPLIVVNCIILGRAEAFASKNTLGDSLLDAIGMGLGFTFALALIGGIREFLTSGSLWNISMIPNWAYDFSLLSLAPGGFIIMGAIMAFKNYLAYRKDIKAGRVPAIPQGFDCRHCCICKLGGVTPPVAPETKK